MADGGLDGAGRGAQLTSTVCGGDPAAATETTASPLPAAAETVTVSVTLCPARSIPEDLLRVS